MKKLFPLIIIISTLLLAGCSNISQDDYDKLQAENKTLQAKLDNYENYLKCQQYLTDVEDDKERVDMIVDLAEALGYDMTDTRANIQSFYDKAYTTLSGEIELLNDINNNLAENGYDYSFDMSEVDETYNSYEDTIASLESSWTNILDALKQQNIK